VLLLNECLLFISLSTQSGNFWIHPRMFRSIPAVQNEFKTFACWGFCSMRIKLQGSRSQSMDMNICNQAQLIKTSQHLHYNVN
jgi:hypothetical protein